MPYPYAPEPYISRPQAENLVDFFGVALTQPQDHPLVFNIAGMAGTGKTTLLKHLIKKFGNQAEIIEFSFRKTIQGLTTEVYLDLMHHLYEQIPDSLRKKTDRQPNSFMRLYYQYFSTAQKLINQSPDNKTPTSETNAKEAKQLLKAAARVLPMAASLFGIDPIATGIGTVATMVTDTNIDATVDTGAAFLTGKERLGQLLQQHHVTKKDQSLQQLMRNPVQRLTKAFVEDLIAQASHKPIIICFDTFEKAPLEIDRWLCQFLLGQSQLQKHRIRIVLAGQQCLTQKEEWRKLEQDDNLISEKTLERFSDKETQAYLQEIHWADTDDIQKILQITGGLPYYLNWIRKKFQQGEEIDLSQGNQAVSNLLFQGITQEQRIVVQLIACGRWFDKTLIRELLREGTLLDRTAISKDFDWFEWLKPQHYVQLIRGKYKFDDVARDVFQTLLQQEDEIRFRNTHLALAQYYQNRADQIMVPDSSEVDRYDNPEWCEAITEYLYHFLLSEQNNRHAQFLNHLFASHYLHAFDVVTNVFVALTSEESLLSATTQKWFQEDITGFTNGTMGLTVAQQESLLRKTEIFQTHIESLKREYERKYEIAIELERFMEIGVGVLIDQIVADSKKAFDLCLQYMAQMEGVGKYAFFLYRSHLHSTPTQLSDLKMARDEAIKLTRSTPAHFSSGLFLEIGALYNRLGCYEDAIASFDKAIQFKPENDQALYLKSGILFILKRYEEAIASFDQVLQFKPDHHDAWYARGVGLCQVKRFEDAIPSFDKSLQFKPNNDQAWQLRGTALVFLKRYEEAIASLDKALQFKPDLDQAWYGRGSVLQELGRYEEAITSYDKALELKPEDPNTFYNKACCYALQANSEAAVKNLKIAISLALEKYREMAKTDSAFDPIRENAVFQSLLTS